MILTVKSSDALDWQASGIDQIKNNIRNILNTRQGEIPYMRDVGLSGDYIDSPFYEAKGAIICDVIENISEYEPRVKVKSVDADIVQPSGEVVISVVVEI